MSPEQWSHKLFGDAEHKSEMQSIIDTLQSELTLEKLISDFYEKMSATLGYDMNASDAFVVRQLSQLSAEIKGDFDFFAAINFEKKQPPKKPAQENVARKRVVREDGESTLDSEESYDLEEMGDNEGDLDDDEDEDYYNCLDSEFYDDDDESDTGFRYRR